MGDVGDRFALAKLFEATKIFDHESYRLHPILIDLDVDRRIAFDPGGFLEQELMFHFTLSSFTTASLSMSNMK